MNNNKINILQFICPTGFYGAERWVLALARNLDPKETRCDLVVTQESEQQNLEIVDYFPSDESQTFKIKMKGRFDLNGVTQLCDIIKKRRIDVIHTHGYKSDIIGILAARKMGIKCISTPHGFGEPKGLKHKIFVALGVFSLRFFHKVVPLSTELMKYVIDRGVKKSTTQYIQNGVDLSEVDVHLSQKVEKSKRPPIKSIGFIGQMVPRKQIKDILEVFDSLWQKDNNIELLLLGDGSVRSDLEIFASNLASKEDIKFLGFRNDRLEILRELDLFVMTSSSEGIPRCLMEAMAMEIPVAAYDIPGIDQLVTNDETGLLSPYGDKITLESNWKKLLYNEDLSINLANQGRKFVLDNFSGKRMAQEYLSLFKSLINKNNI